MATVDSRAEKPIFCEGAWTDAVIGSDGNPIYTYATLWPNDRLPSLEEAARRAGVTLSILARNDNLLAEPYLSEMNMWAKKKHEFRVPQTATLIELVSTEGPPSPFDLFYP